MRKNREQRQKIDHESVGLCLARLREQLRVILNQQFMYTVNSTHRRISRLTDKAVDFIDILRDLLELAAARELPIDTTFRYYHPHAANDLRFEQDLLAGISVERAEKFQARAMLREKAFKFSEKFVSFDADDRLTASLFLFSSINTIADVMDQAAGRLPHGETNKIRRVASLAITALHRLSFAIEGCRICR